MTTIARIHYDICPECGYENPEKRNACPICENRLYSRNAEEHDRYLRLIQAEHGKRSLQWWIGWAVVAVIALVPIVFVLTGAKMTWLPGAGFLFSLTVFAWRLVDLRKKRQGSAVFLSRYKLS